MDKKTISIAVLVTAVVLLGAFLFKVPAVVTVTDTIKESLGANPGPAFLCETATWNPTAINELNNATTSVQVIGASRGDILYATFATSTAAGVQNVDKYSVSANVSSTNNIIVSVSSLASTSIDLATGTVRACYSHSF